MTGDQADARCENGGDLLYTLDFRAEAAKLPIDILVGTVHMKDVADLRLAAGDQAGKEERRAGAHIERTHRCSGQRAGTADDGGGAGLNELGAEFTQFAEVQKAVIKDALVDKTHAVCLGQQDGHRRLQIRRQPRIRHGLHLR